MHVLPSACADVTKVNRATVVKPAFLMEYQRFHIQGRLTQRRFASVERDGKRFSAPVGAFIERIGDRPISAVMAGQ